MTGIENGEANSKTKFKMAVIEMQQMSVRVADMATMLNAVGVVDLDTLKYAEEVNEACDSLLWLARNR